MTAATAPCLADLGGLPFLDDTFTAGRLLAITAAVRYAVACRRRLAASGRAAEAEAWLAPARAIALSNSATPMPAQPLTADRERKVTAALTRLADVLPSWQLLLRLPVRYARLHPAQGAISASCRDWPQHVLLADEAFATERELTEQVLHELAHQWLYLIEDVWPLQIPSADRLTLPSGTRDRSPAEVLGAAHVAAVLVRLYRQTGTGHAAGRIRSLTAYGGGCLEMASAAGTQLTEAGTLITQRLKETF
jgi:hypothetical protein